MANRVSLGQRTTGQFGLFISKPGLNVLTITSDSQYLFNSNWKTFQVAQTGRVAITALPYTLTHTDLGFRPFVEAYVGGWNYVCGVHLSNTQIRFQAFDSFDPQPNGYTKEVLYTVYASVL